MWMILANLLMIIMLICFGAAWPLSIYKVLKTRIAHGKSLFFAWVILLGYICGAAQGLIRNLTADHNDILAILTTALFIINTFMVLIDLTLTYRYRHPMPEPRKTD